MKFVCAGSSSSGNAYALQDEDGSTLFIEAGRHFKEIEVQLNYKIDYAHAWLVASHEHGDHCKFIEEYAKRGIECYSTRNTSEKYPNVEYMRYTKVLGKFIVRPLAVEHDVPDLGFLISHPEFGNLFFATDCYSISYELKNVKNWLIECNYSDDILTKAWLDNAINKAQRDRLMLSHFSEQNCMNYLDTCHAETSNCIILCHTSRRHLDPIETKERFEAHFGVPTYIAKKGLTLELNDKGL